MQKRERDRERERERERERLFFAFAQCSTLLLLSRSVVRFFVNSFLFPLLLCLTVHLSIEGLNGRVRDERPDHAAETNKKKSWFSAG